MVNELKKMVKETILIPKSKRFILRHITLKDVGDYYECFNDPLARKNFRTHPKDLTHARKKVRKMISDMNPKKGKKPTGEAFAIEMNGKFAGYVDIHGLNEKYKEHIGLIGYCIHRDFRGKGVTTEAVKLVVKHAFKKYKLKRLEGMCRTSNKASARVLEKAGFKLEGILRKIKFVDGKYSDDMLWARVR